jgi:type II secretory pathway pseudopilin PulG
MPHLRKKRAGFTLVEVVLIVVIIGLMLAIIIPGVLQLRKRRQADALRAELKTLDAALQKYALETHSPPGAHPGFSDLKKYVDPSSPVYKTDGRDIFGRPFGPYTVGGHPRVSDETYRQLSDIADASFWSGYR